MILDIINHKVQKSYKTVCVDIFLPLYQNKYHNIILEFNRNLIIFLCTKNANILFNLFLK